MRRILLIVVVFVSSAAAAFADIPPEPGKSSNRVKKPVAISTNLDISLDRTATEARLIIPASQLKQLRAELDTLEAGDPTAGLTGGAGPQGLQTVMTGVLLSVGLILGGLWLWRSGGTQARMRAAGVVVLAAASAGAGFLYGNIGPPLEARSITGKMFSPAVHQYGSGSGRIKLETGEGQRVRLVVPNPKEPKPDDE